MKKRKCITKSFYSYKIVGDIDDFINEYLENYSIIDIKQVSHKDYLFITIIYEIELDEDQELLKTVVKLIEKKGTMSINLLQNELGIGFNRASTSLRTLVKLNIISSDDKRLIVSYDEAIKLIEGNYR